MEAAIESGDEWRGVSGTSNNIYTTTKMTSGIIPHITHFAGITAIIPLNSRDAVTGIKSY